MKRYYDLRSKIVHGSGLKPIVRRVVRAVIYATAHTNIRLTGKYIDEQLDRALLDTEARQDLRRALGLE